MPFYNPHQPSTLPIRSHRQELESHRQGHVQLDPLSWLNAWLFHGLFRKTVSQSNLLQLPVARHRSCSNCRVRDQHGWDGRDGWDGTVEMVETVGTIRTIRMVGKGRRPKRRKKKKTKKQKKKKKKKKKKQRSRIKRKKKGKKRNQFFLFT